MSKSRNELVETLSEKEKYENYLGSLEELKTRGEVSEERYNSLKNEYENRITENKIKIEQFKKDFELELASKKIEKNMLEKQCENLEARVKVSEIEYNVYQKEKTKLDRQIERLNREVSNLQTLLSAERASDIRGDVGVVAKSVEDLKPSQIILGDVFISPFKLLGKHYSLGIPLAINVGIASLVASLVASLEKEVEKEVAGLGADTTLYLVIGILIVGLIAVAATFFMTGWVLAMMKEIKESGETTPESSFLILRENMVPIILGWFLASLIMGIGTIMLIIPGIILMAALSCTVPAIVMHNFDAVNGLKASWKFCWEGKNFWRLLVLVVSMAFISNIEYVGSFIAPLWIPYAYMEYVGG